MNQSAAIILKTLILGTGRKDALLRFLPSSERDLLDKLGKVSKNVQIEDFENADLLESVHWSWFLPTLKTYREDAQEMFISALDFQSAKNLTHELHLPLPNSNINISFKNYLRKVLASSLLGPIDQLLPKHYLPQTSIQNLLHLSKLQLTKIIQMLSLYDLAIELRQIVETKILKKIYSLLTEEEKKFLKKIMHLPDPYTQTRIPIDRWIKKEEAFRLTLHKKGLTRFALGLSGKHPDFVWYICHQLDIGRGSALFKLCQKEPIPHVTDAIERQIEELLKHHD